MRQRIGQALLDSLTGLNHQRARNVSMSLGHLPVAFSVAPRLSTS